MRALAAIINFAFFVRELLIESSINSEIFTGIDAQLNIATGARMTPIIEVFPPHKRNFWKPRKIGNFRTISANFLDFLQILEVLCALHGRGLTAQWSSWCSVATRQVKGVAVALISDPTGLFHNDKPNYQCNVNRKCSA